jgi:hypothetical protein
MKRIKNFATFVAIGLIATSSLFSCTSANEQHVQQPVQQPSPTPVDTTAIVDTTATDSTTVEQIVYTTIGIETSVPIEFYESDSLSIPPDSLLHLAGVKFIETEGKYTLQTDSTLIPQEINIAWNKGEVTISRWGTSKEFKGKKLTMDNDSIFIDGKAVVFETPVKVIKIGVPKGNPITCSGNNLHLSSSVQLGTVQLQAGGESEIALDATNASEIRLTGKSTMTGSCAVISVLSLTDSSNIVMKSCDSIGMISAKGKPKITYPKNTKVTSEKTSDNTEVVIK